MKHLVILLVTAFFFVSSAALQAQDPKEDPVKTQTKTKEKTKEKSDGENGQQYKYMVKSQSQTKSKSKIEHGPGFVDENGDGYNDNAPDQDGEGIPNGADPDYDGPKERKGNARGFVDEDGDGLNDNARDHDGDGIPNGQDEDYTPPKDGSGAGHGYSHKNGEVNGKNMHKQGKGSGLGPCSGEGLGTGQSDTGNQQSQKRSGGKK